MNVSSLPFNEAEQAYVSTESELTCHCLATLIHNSKLDTREIKQNVLIISCLKLVEKNVSHIKTPHWQAVSCSYIIILKPLTSVLQCLIITLMYRTHTSLKPRNYFHIFTCNGGGEGHVSILKTWVLFFQCFFGTLMSINNLRFSCVCKVPCKGWGACQYYPENGF